MNRVVFTFNDVAYRYVLVPVSRTWLERVPEPARRSVGNFFGNLKAPIYLVNHLAQLELTAALHDVERFAINTTWGVLGFRDPAGERFGIEAAPTGFADTLSHHGAGHGVYLTLPFVGPSDVKSGTGLLADWLLNPIRYFTENPTTLGVQSLDYVQEAAPQADAYPELRAESDDPYVFFRNLHLERVQRDADYP
jgi:phospholipid-binding lipoprotein MlaA